MAESIPILTFHSLDGQPSVISFRPDVFKRGMTELYENGYRTMRLLEAANCLSRGRTFPDRSFVITFDDGYETVYEEAFPVLQCYGMSATVFLAVGEKGVMDSAHRLPPLNGRSMLSWNEIKEMKQWGLGFGAHTLTHPDLTRLRLERVEAEICNSKAIIEDALGIPVVSFAYPYGRYNHQILKMAQQSFTCACTDKLGLMSVDSDPYALERVDAYYLRTDKLFDLILTRAFPHYIQVRGIFRRIRRGIRLN